MSGQAPEPEPAIESQPPAQLAPAVPLEEVDRTAARVQELIAAGDEAAAWQRLRQLHPADVGLILASLPRASSEALLQIASPQTVTWMLRHMNPVEASRLGARLSIQTLSFILNQVNPQTRSTHSSSCRSAGPSKSPSSWNNPLPKANSSARIPTPPAR